MQFGLKPVCSIDKPQATECIVLLSGGLDSAACVHLLRKQFDVRGVHVSYGQASERQEHMAAVSVADFFQIPLSIFSLQGARSKSDGEIIGRNAFLVFTALLEATAPQVVIALGIHAGTPYYDCSHGFIRAIQCIIDASSDGSVRVVTPFADWSKRDIWEYCLSHGVPVDLTYSCERGAEQPCNKCLSCQDLEALRVCQKHTNSA